MEWPPASSTGCHAFCLHMPVQGSSLREPIPAGRGDCCMYIVHRGAQTYRFQLPHMSIVASGVLSLDIGCISKRYAKTVVSWHNGTIRPISECEHLDIEASDMVSAGTSVIALPLQRLVTGVSSRHVQLSTHSPPDLGYNCIHRCEIHNLSDIFVFSCGLCLELDVKMSYCSLPSAGPRPWELVCAIGAS